MQSPHSRVPQPAISPFLLYTEEFPPTGACAPPFPIPNLSLSLQSINHSFQHFQPTFKKSPPFNTHHVSIRLSRGQPFPQTPSDRPVHKASAKPLVSTTTPGRPLCLMYLNHLTSTVSTRYIPVVAAIGLGTCTIFPRTYPPAPVHPTNPYPHRLRRLQLLQRG